MNRCSVVRSVLALSLAAVVVGCQSCPDCPTAEWDSVDSVQYVDSNLRGIGLQARAADGSLVRAGQPAGGLVLAPEVSGIGMVADLRWSISKVVDREARKQISHHVRAFGGSETSTTSEVVTPVQVGMVIECPPSKDCPVFVEWRLCKFERTSDPVVWPSQDPMQVAAGRTEIVSASQKITLGCDEFVGMQRMSADWYRFVVRASVAGLDSPQLYCSSPVKGSSIPSVDGDLQFAWTSRADSQARERCVAYLVVGGKDFGVKGEHSAPFTWRGAAAGGIDFQVAFHVDRKVDRAVTWTCDRSGSACGKTIAPRKYVKTIEPTESPDALGKWVSQQGLPMPTAPLAHGMGVNERVRLSASPLKVTWQLNRGEGHDVLLVAGHPDIVTSGSFVVDDDAELAERLITVGADALAKLSSSDEVVLVVNVEAAADKLRDAPSPFPVFSKPIRASVLSAGGPRAAAQ